MKIHSNKKWQGIIKYHVAFDPKTEDLIAIEITDDKVADSTILPMLIDKSPKRV